MLPADLLRSAGAVARAAALAAVFGCAGGSTTPAPEPVPPPAEVPQPASGVHRPDSLVGAWKMVPDEHKPRELKIIEAATSGKDQKVARLGDLTAQEQAIYDEWTRKKGKEVDAKLAELALLRSYLVEFTEHEVTLQFGEAHRYGPVPYTVASSTDDTIAVTFDPGMGRGLETHTYVFETPTRGAVAVTTADGQRFDPIRVTRKPRDP
jgi:hypothetical protein